MKSRKPRYKMDIEKMWEEEGLICTPAYGGLLISDLDAPETIYFDAEKGTLRLVSASEIEQLTLN